MDDERVESRSRASADADLEEGELPSPPPPPLPGKMLSLRRAAAVGSSERRLFWSAEELGRRKRQ